MVALVACSAQPGEIRSIRARTLPGCDLSEVTTLELEALDDQAARGASFVEVSPGGRVDLPSLPEGALAFVARGRSSDGVLRAFGILDVEEGGAHGVIHAARRACSLVDEQGAIARIPKVIAPSVATSSRGALLAGGVGEDGIARSDLVFVEARTAKVRRVGLRRRRSGAAAILFPDHAIVAGGADLATWEDAEIVDLATLSIAGSIALSEPRAEAGAVVLASGEGLLVGGRGRAPALATLEIVSPTRSVASTLDLATLARARRAPKVVRLATSEILVVGGFDAAGAPVPDVEIFDARARSRLAVLPFPAASNVAVSALPSGAALVVAGNDGGPLRVHLVRTDAVDALPSIADGGAPLLVDATDGAPFLATATLRRFDPWSGTFALFEAPLAGRFFALGAGVIAAARDDGSFGVVRYDVRTFLAIDAEPLGLGSTAHLVPDRLAVRVGRDGLVVPPGARVAVADTTYRGVVVRVGAVGRSFPRVELRTPEGILVARIDDDGACRPPPSSNESDVTEIVRARDGSLVVRVGAAERACTPLVAGDVRVSISLVAGAREARVRGLTLMRQ